MKEEVQGTCRPLRNVGFEWGAEYIVSDGGFLACIEKVSVEKDLSNLWNHIFILDLVCKQG